MKKYIWLLAALFLFSGCSDAEETPKEMAAPTANCAEAVVSKPNDTKRLAKIVNATRAVSEYFPKKFFI